MEFAKRKECAQLSKLPLFRWKGDLGKTGRNRSTGRRRFQAILIGRKSHFRRLASTRGDV